MLKLSKEEQDKIAQAVKQAELKTSGEIATAIIPQSYDYAIYELFLAVVMGLIYSVIIFSFSAELESWLKGMIWNYHIYYLTGFYLFSTFIVILIIYFLANIPFIDRLIVPRGIMLSWVERRAMQHFAQSGVGHTKDGTGILIFISVLERRVQLIADYGISNKVDQSRWQSIVNKITLGIRSGNIADNLCEAIGECGELLNKDFPRAIDDINELDDHIVQLDK